MVQLPPWLKAPTLMDNRVMSQSSLVEVMKIMEQWRPGFKLEMVAINHIKHNLLEVMLVHWSKKWGSVPTSTTDTNDVNIVVNCKISGTPSCMDPHLLGVSDTGRCTTIRGLPATLMALNPRVWMRLLCHRAPTTLCHRPLLYTELKTSPWSGPATSQRSCR